MEIVYKGSEVPNKVNVDTDTINKNLKSLLHHSHDQLGDVIMKMLITSYTLKDIDIHLPDYSCYVFPALRAIEGVMKSILFNKGFEADNSNQYFYGVFRKEGTRYVVTDEYKSFINDNNTCRALENCYTYYNRQRHELFHVNDLVDSSKMIENKDHASQIIDKIIEIIDEAYRIMSS
jgi:hypothetical protein